MKQTIAATLALWTALGAPGLAPYVHARAVFKAAPTRSSTAPALSAALRLPLTLPAMPARIGALRPLADQAPLDVIGAVRQSAALNAAGIELQAALPQSALAPEPGEAQSLEDSRDWAEGSFQFLKGDGGVAAPAGAVKAPPSAWRRWLKPAAAAAAIAGTAATAASSPISPIEAAPAVAASNAASAAVGSSASRAGPVLDFLGNAGYIIGNITAFLFPIPQIYKTFKDGNAKATPVWQSVILAAASFALGLVNATVAAKPFWGIQNLFGGLIILSIVPINWWLSRRQAARTDKALLATALVTAMVLAASAGLYFAAAAVIPGLLAGMLAPAAISSLALWIQAVTGAMYFMLFLPDIASVARGKVPKGFTRAFSFNFFLASAAFVLWTSQAALNAAPGSSERMQFIIYAVLNAAYAVVSFVSFRLARRD